MKMKRTGPTNAMMQELIAVLRKASFNTDVSIWGRIVEDLSKPSRQRRAVNIYKLDKYSKDGETVVVPGKVLGMGDLTHKVRVAAFTFSRQAEEKIKKAGGETLAIRDILRENPEGKNVRILG